MDGVGERTSILWLIKGLDAGGAERLLLSFAHKGDHSRFDFHVAYLLPEQNHLVAELERSGVSVHCLDAPHVWNLRWLLRLWRLLRTEGIDVVHDHSPLVASPARLLVRAVPKARRPRLITTEHNLWASHNPLTRLFNRVTIGFDDQVFAVSQPVKESMSRRIRGRVEVLIPGVDVEAILARRVERADARAELGLADDEIVVVTVANLRTNKDYPTMLGAAKLLVDAGIAATFLAVGHGPLHADLQRLRDELGLGDRFRFLGYRSDPIRVMAAGDIFCMSSVHEGMPIAMMEAMAIGLPVVATSVGGIPQLVTDDSLGLLVPPSDIAGLAEALERSAGTVRTRIVGSGIIDTTSLDIGEAVRRQSASYEMARGRCVD